MSLFNKFRKAIGRPRNRDRLPAHVSVGRHSYGITRHMFIRPTAQAPCRIGAFCAFADQVMIFGQADHPTDTVSSYPFRSEHFMADAPPAEPVTRGPVTIGNDVWVGARAIILSGVTIGDGAVIGAGAVVTRDVAPYSVMVGNPAKAVRKRFSDRQIAALLALRWWDWPDEKIARMEPLLYGGIDAFLAAAADAGHAESAASACPPHTTPDR